MESPYSKIDQAAHVAELARFPSTNSIAPRADGKKLILAQAQRLHDSGPDNSTSSSRSGLSEPDWDVIS